MVCNTEEPRHTCVALVQDVVGVDCILAQAHRIFPPDVVQSRCCCPCPRHILQGTCSSVLSDPFLHFQTEVLVRL